MYLGEYLLWWHVEGNGSQVYVHYRIRAGQNKEQARTFGATGHDASQAHDNGTLILLHDLLKYPVADNKIIIFHLKKCSASFSFTAMIQNKNSILS